jgi:hypothetical protein
MADVFTQHLGRGCYPSPALLYSTYITSRNETSKAGCLKLPSLSYYGLSILRNNILTTIVPFSKLRMWEQISQQIKLSEILDFQSAASGSRIWVLYDSLLPPQSPSQQQLIYGHLEIIQDGTSSSKVLPLLQEQGT